MTVQLIGIDCATDPKKVGVAAAEYVGKGKCKNVQICLDHTKKGIHKFIVTRIENRTALLALDAPLGWPVGLSKALGGHKAGGFIDQDPDRLFHRETDRFVREQTGKKPLEVGANLIARTAMAALDLLEVIRVKAELEPIPLAKDLDSIKGTQAIEVYPALALLGDEDPKFKGYKKKDCGEARKEIIEFVAKKLDTEIPAKASDVDHTVDACLCLLIACQFLDGDCLGPQANSWDLYDQEGWIWFHKDLATGKPKQWASKRWLEK